MRPKEPVVVGQRTVGGPPCALCSRGLHSGIIHRQPAGSNEDFRVRVFLVLRARMFVQGLIQKRAEKAGQVEEDCGSEAMDKGKNPEVVIY